MTSGSAIPPESDDGAADTAESVIAADFAAIYLRAARLQNFRGIQDATVEFEEDITVLAGRNNSGKSRILRGIAVSLNAHSAEQDDLTNLSPDDATIDLIFAPASGTGGEEFDRRVAGRAAELIQLTSEEPPIERFAWRTVLSRSREGAGLQVNTYGLIFDASTGAWELPEHPIRVSQLQRELAAGELVETRRDVVEDLGRRSSAIRRILNDLEVPAEQREAIESRLAGLGSEIVSASDSLGAIHGALIKLTGAIDEIGQPTFEPLPVRLEELARTVSLNLNTGDGDLPMRFHGSGSRSLASIQIQSVHYDRRLGKDGPALRPHPVSLIEEPESHLHPQAQFELHGLLRAVRGQVVVSSHSTHLATVVEPRSLRLLQRSGTQLRVVDLKPAESDQAATQRERRPSIHLREMEKLRRLVERPFGELLFSSAVVIGDGATERALLPPLVRHALGGRAHGICVVDPGGMGNELAIAAVKFAELVGIPWVLFADADRPGQEAANRLVTEIGDGDRSRIIWVPGEDEQADKNTATEKMLVDFNSELCERVCVELGYDISSGKLLKFMSQNKGVLGSFIAQALIELGPWPGKDNAAQETLWPAAICQLVRKLDDLLPSAGSINA